jgi:phosphopentomutase
VHLERAFPTYPTGFPLELLTAFERATGRAAIGNITASGTEIIERYAQEQRRTGAWIVYTSADSVFQIAADEDVISLSELYAACQTARELLVAPHNVSRVIARPFVREGSGYRRTAHRRDYSVAPPAETLLDTLAASGIARHGVGKVDDLFAQRAISSLHTATNEEGIAAINGFIRGPDSGLCFANLVDFDQLYGHRNDVAGFYRALRVFDRAVPMFIDALREDDLLIITADHGNDPTTPSTDHSRERVPLLVVGPRIAGSALGERPTFSDVGATLGEWFRVQYAGHGRSFLSEVLA